MQTLLQAHTQRLERQHKAHRQQLAAQHTAEVQSKADAMSAQQQQQLRVAEEAAAAEHAEQLTRGRQQLERAEALLAAEKQKSTALKVWPALPRSSTLTATVYHTHGWSLS